MENTSLIPEAADLELEALLNKRRAATARAQKRSRQQELNRRCQRAVLSAIPYLAGIILVGLLWRWLLPPINWLALGACCWALGWFPGKIIGGGARHGRD